MKQSEKNRNVIENFILHYTHENIDEAEGEARDMYDALDDYISEDHVDGVDADAYAEQYKIQEAKQNLKEAGYFTDNLWSVNDIIYDYKEKDGSLVSKEKAYEVVKSVMENPLIIEYINEQISFTASEKTFNLINT